MSEMSMTPWLWDAIWSQFVEHPATIDRFPDFTRGIIALNVIPLAANKQADLTIAYLNKLSLESITMSHIVQIAIESIEQDIVMGKRN